MDAIGLGCRKGASHRGTAGGTIRVTRHAGVVNFGFQRRSGTRSIALGNLAVITTQNHQVLATQFAETAGVDLEDPVSPVVAGDRVGHEVEGVRARQHDRVLTGR